MKEIIENCHRQLQSSVAHLQSINKIFSLIDSHLNRIIHFIKLIKEDLLSNIWNGQYFIQPLESILSLPQKSNFGFNWYNFPPSNILHKGSIADWLYYMKVQKNV